MRRKIESILEESTEYVCMYICTYMYARTYIPDRMGQKKEVESLEGMLDFYFLISFLLVNVLVHMMKERRRFRGT